MKKKKRGSAQLIIYFQSFFFLFSPPRFKVCNRSKWNKSKQPLAGPTDEKALNDEDISFAEFSGARRGDPVIICRRIQFLLQAPNLLSSSSCLGARAS